MVPVNELYVGTGGVEEGEEVAVHALIVRVLVALEYVAQDQLLEVLLHAQLPGVDR